MAWPRPHFVTLFLCMIPLGCASSGDPTVNSTACTATLPASEDCGTAAPSYATDIAPLVETYCLACHFAGNHNSSVVLETQSQLNHQRGLVETQVYRCQMPPSDGEALRTTDRELLLKWLVCGAPSN
jgi:uncharacterized membrane protein